jgi:hypothetical protein
MASEKKAAPPVAEKSAPTSTAEKRYAVRHTIVLGKGESREERRAGTVTAAEVGGEAVVERLLKTGAIGDLDAPMRPSEASEHRARALVVDIARRRGLITVEGERYTFAGETYSGAGELERIPLTALVDAIVAS